MDSIKRGIGDRTQCLLFDVRGTKYENRKGEFLQGEVAERFEKVRDFLNKYTLDETGKNKVGEASASPT